MAERMRHDTTTWDNFVHFCGGLGGIQIAGVKPGVGDAWLGKRLGDVARAAGAADLDSVAAYEAVFDFFLANRGEVAIITHYGNEATVERFFRRPTMAISKRPSGWPRREASKRTAWPETSMRSARKSAWWLSP